MKKILLSLILALTIFLPMTVEAADVPDFVEIGGGNVYFNKTDRSSDSGTVYVFNARSLNADLNNDYVARYINLLTSRYNFVQVGYEKKKWSSKRLQQNRPTETWYFRYTGSKNVGTLSGSCNLRIKRTRELDKGVVSFGITVAPGLTFAGNYGTPRPSGGNGEKECIDCRGTGKCSTCGGRGYYDVGYDHPCGACRTSGKCIFCNGRGYR